MKLATLKNGSPDDRLIIVSSDGTRYAETQVAATMLSAIEDWQNVASALGAEA